MMSRKEWTITMLEYTNIEAFPNAFLYAGRAPFEGDTPITYTICLLKSGEDMVLIDTGYDRTKPQSLAFSLAEAHQNYRSPAEVLEKVGVGAAEIKHVILTHAHWDHMGGLNLFPNAQFYIQKDELLKWVETAALPDEYRVIKTPVLGDDLMEAMDMVRAGRMTLIDGDVDGLFDGIDIRVAPYGHSWASNVILIHTKAGTYAFIGDVAYVKKNITGLENDGAALPNGLGIGGGYHMVKSMLDIKKWVGGDTGRILLTHEIGIWDEVKAEIAADGLHAGYVVK